MAFRQTEYKPPQRSEEDYQWEWAENGLKNSVKYAADANILVVSRHLKPGMDKVAVANLINRLAETGQLAVSQEWSNLFDEFYSSEFGRRFVKSESTEGLLVRALLAAKLPLSVANLELVSSNPSVMATLPLTDAFTAQERAQQQAAAQKIKDEQDRATIIPTLLGWFESSQHALYKDNKYAWDRILKQESNRLSAMSANDLRSEFATRTERRRIRGLAPEEYRAEVTISRAAGEQPVPQAKMVQAMQQFTPGTTYTTRDGVTFELTRKSLIECANRNPALFREVTRVKGASLINDILAGRV